MTGAFDHEFGPRRGGRFLDQANQAIQLSLGGFVAFQKAPNPFYGLDQAGFGDGFQQVVERIHLKGPDRVVVKGGGKNEQGKRRLLLNQAAHDPQPIQTRHLHIQKDNLRRFFPHHLDRFHAVLGLPDDIDFRETFEQERQLFTCRPLIIHNQRANFHELTPLETVPSTRSVYRESIIVQKSISSKT